MHQLFFEKHPKLKHVKYEYCLSYFHENFGYRFGWPQVVCSTYEELNTKIKSTTLNEAAKRSAAAELMVHKRRANKLYKKLQSVTELSKNDAKISGVVFEFMQNLPLPFLPVQETFYLRKLWYYVFNVHDLKTRQSVFYNHWEEARKGSLRCVHLCLISLKCTSHRKWRFFMSFVMRAAGTTVIIHYAGCCSLLLWVVVFKKFTSTIL